MHWNYEAKGIFIALYYDHIWKYYNNIDLARQDASITANTQELPLYDLSKIHLANLKIYYSKYGIFIDFILEQYAYYNLVRAKSGDYVIDGGACYGDTALYFSNLVGDSGKVFAFEFVDENIAIFNQNIALNPHINNITLVKRPLYSNSSTIVSYDGVGGSARLEKDSAKNNTITTLSIDDFMVESKIPRMDFIKFDIEGSELEALKGAKNTIMKYKPKLAICLYHSFSHYTDIPIYLHSLVPEYEFYFDHFTLGVIESVLFARIKE